MKTRSFLGTYSNHLLLGSIFVLLLLLAGGSYLRFVVLHDYLVSYEGECDPYTESCFIGCDDDACEDVYYYTEIERRAPELYAECGKNILECDVAYECQADDTTCSVTYCDPVTAEADSCETLTYTDV